MVTLEYPIDNNYIQAVCQGNIHFIHYTEALKAQFNRWASYQ